ncbi:MAG: hypothetical protein H0W64_12655 [Gammaproteobacteria bacterium]|nr:hypothetical protein [Gammaproteobacteria bacterium]
MTVYLLGFIILRILLHEVIPTTSGIIYHNTHFPIGRASSFGFFTYYPILCADKHFTGREAILDLGSGYGHDFSWIAIP